eukprot:9493330-Pyramimonas_sp.AAC.1
MICFTVELQPRKWEATRLNQPWNEPHAKYQLAKSWKINYGSNAAGSRLMTHEPLNIGEEVWFCSATGASALVPTRFLITATIALGP